jgi:regulator of protease activity HflC (stomatin/prohibitin superfamily)
MGVVFAAIFALMLGACTQIDTGNVGVEQTVGAVKLEELSPGVYFTMFKSVHEMTAKEISLPLDDLKPKTRDNITMTDFDVDVYYRINPVKIADLFVKYQGDVTKDSSGDLIVAKERVKRSAREAAYKVASEYDALTMHQKRTEIATNILAALKQEMSNIDSDAFTFTDVNIRSLVTDPALEATIRSKVETQNKIDQKQKEIDLAKAEAERKKVEAQGEANANIIIANSLDARLIELKRIEAQQAFAKAGTHTVLMQGGATAMVNVGK